MADFTNNEFTVALNNYFKTLGTLAQQLVDLASAVINTAGSLLAPITKSATGLVGSASNTVTQVYQGAAAAIAPKK
jgi:hypothetical protein